jgi:hypothetical protein
MDLEINNNNGDVEFYKELCNMILLKGTANALEKQKSEIEDKEDNYPELQSLSIEDDLKGSKSCKSCSMHVGHSPHGRDSCFMAQDQMNSSKINGFNTNN